MAEIIKFKPARVWRAPLLAPAKRVERPTKRLQVTKDVFTGAVTFEKQDGTWVVSIVPYCLTYLKGIRAADFKIEIENDGWTWEWIK